MRTKIMVPNADGSAAITFQEFEAIPSAGSVIVFENGNAYIVDSATPSPGDPDGCQVVLWVRTPKLAQRPASGFIQGHNINPLSF